MISPHTPDGLKPHSEQYDFKVALGHLDMAYVHAVGYTGQMARAASATRQRFLKKGDDTEDGQHLLVSVGKNGNANNDESSLCVQS